MSLVVDASIAIAWVIPDEQTEAAREVLRRVGAEGAAVPSLWKLDVANVLWSAIRRKRCTREFAADALESLEDLRLTIDDETDVHAWNATWRVASEFNLTVYDAAYLELAIRRRATLATLDAALAKAGQSAGLEVICD